LDAEKFSSKIISPVFTELYYSLHNVTYLEEEEEGGGHRSSG